MAVVHRWVCLAFDYAFVHLWELHHYDALGHLNEAMQVFPLIGSAAGVSHCGPVHQGVQTVLL